MKELEQKADESKTTKFVGLFTFDDLKKAFIDGQDSISAQIGYEQFGDMDPYPKKIINKNFERWFEENFK